LDISATHLGLALLRQLLGFNGNGDVAMSGISGSKPVERLPAASDT
jgi:hypothetical protein